MSRARRVGIVGLLALASGVGAANGAEPSDADLRSAASWCATAARVARGWRDASLPERYVRRTLTVAVTELDDLDRSVGRRGDATAHARIAQASRVVRRLAAAAEGHDANAAAALVREADRESDALAPRNASPR